MPFVWQQCEVVKWKLIILVASRKRVRALETKHARVWLVLFLTECKLIILLHFRENACVNPFCLSG